MSSLPVNPDPRDGADAPEDAVGRAAFYLAGALDDRDAASIEAALATGDEALISAVSEFGDAVIALGDSIASAAPGLREGPSPDARANLLRRLEARVAELPRQQRAQIWRGWNSDQLADEGPNRGLFTLYARDGRWEETGVEGVQVRRLFVDRPNNRMTAMFRMAPGSEYPDHMHDGVEECFVLEGELRVGEAITMRAGDYQRADGGSHHGRQWTETGCVILVSSSLSDEIVE
ncbi:MAG TPA: cupin domain-containing protein [Phycisphaerales bacterium]|nr:cupin domain-containing protein [Phycisphaerales bacterium]HMP37065.1 cupin domain-containing protein [Phycisphaerales bacterium]